MRISSAANKVRRLKRRSVICFFDINQSHPLSLLPHSIHDAPYGWRPLYRSCFRKNFCASFVVMILPSKNMAQTSAYLAQNSTSCETITIVTPSALSFCRNTASFSLKGPSSPLVGSSNSRIFGSNKGPSPTLHAVVLPAEIIRMHGEEMFQFCELNHSFNSGVFFFLRQRELG